MSVRVRIPAPLRSVTDGESVVSVAGEDLAGCLAELEQQFPALRPRLRDDAGALRRFVNLYVNGALLLSSNAIEHKNYGRVGMEVRYADVSFDNTVYRGDGEGRVHQIFTQRL